MLAWSLLGIALAGAGAGASVEPRARGGDEGSLPLEPMPSEAHQNNVQGPSPAIEGDGAGAPAAARAPVEPVPSAISEGAPRGARPRPRRRLRERLDFFPYGWVRTDAIYYAAKDEGYSNLSLASARLGGGVTAGPITAFVTLEAGAAKGPQLFDAFVRWDAAPRLSLRAGQFKAPFGYRFNAPDLVDELPRAPLSMFAATPGRQVGIEGQYDLWGHARVALAVLSGIGQNREANNTRVALAGKLEVRPLAFRRRGPELLIVASLYTYSKTNGFSPTIHSALGFDFFHGVPASGRAYRVAGGGGLFWRFVSVRGEYFYTVDARERDTDGDPFTAGEPLPPMIGAGAYVQAGVVVTGQDKDPATLLPRLASARLRDGAVELAGRYEVFRSGALDVVGNGVQAVTGGVNWIVLRHLRIFAGASWQRLDAAVPEIPAARSWGLTGGVAGYFLGRAGQGD